MVSSNASTTFQPSTLSAVTGYDGFHGNIVVRIENAISLNRGEVIVWRVSWTHRCTCERLYSWMLSSNLSSTAFRLRSSGAAMIRNGYITTSMWIEGFELPLVLFHVYHKYDIDVTEWLHASKTGRGLPHRNNSIERKWSPPGNAARPSKSSLEYACAKTSLPRSGGDCLIAGT